MELVESARAGGLHVGAIQVEPNRKAPARPARGGGALDRRAQLHVDGARAAERARLDALERHPEQRAARALAAEVVTLGAGLDRAAVLAAVVRALALTR